ncbi:MAG: regulatory protein RecX [Candidatus Omnitrophota bacterium]|nr:regulatory protein RecX [Candidatus Omnitrophota bacterium]
MDNSGDKELKKAKNYCVRLLSIRPRSEREVETRLRTRGCGGRTLKRAIESLKEDGLVNDLEFAREWVDSRIRSSPRGKRMLAAELEKKGITRDVVRKAMEERSADLDERVVTAGLIRKKLSFEKRSTHAKLKGKIFRFLAGKGFDPEIAEEVINEILGV